MVISESKLRVIIRESIYRILDEIGGGIHPNRQMDLFMGQDEVNDFHSEADEMMFQALIKAESACGWSHSNSVRVNGGVRYDCYADGESSASATEFLDMVKKMSPRPQNVSIVKLRYRHAPEIHRIGIIIKDIVD